MHSRKLSVGKSLTWRSIGVMLLAVITWFVTGDVLAVTIITILHHTAFAVIFYFHDRVWGSVSMGWQVWVRALTYEFGLGFLVLGVITFVVTGSWFQVTRITVAYLGTRYLLFPVHEWLYARQLGQREAH